MAKVTVDLDYKGIPLPNVPQLTGSVFLTYDMQNAFMSNTRTLGGCGHGVSRRSDNSNAFCYLPGLPIRF